MLELLGVARALVFGADLKRLDYAAKKHGKAVEAGTTENSMSDFVRGKGFLTK